jgi:hypothetical protein
MSDNLNKEMALLTAEIREDCYEDMQGYFTVIGMEGLLSAITKVAVMENDLIASALLKAAKITYVELMEEM